MQVCDFIPLRTLPGAVVAVAESGFEERVEPEAVGGVLGAPFGSAEGLLGAGSDPGELSKAGQLAFSDGFVRGEGGPPHGRSRGMADEGDS